MLFSRLRAFLPRPTMQGYASCTSDQYPTKIASSALLSLSGRPLTEAVVPSDGESPQMFAYEFSMGRNRQTFVRPQLNKTRT
jgi:hypothetical protein